MIIRILAALLTLTLGAQAQARDWDQIKKSGTLKFATEGGFAPFNFFEGQKLTGFEVEVAEAMTKQLGLKIEWVTLGFDSLLIGLNQNRYDAVIASHGITPERAKAVDFANPHYCTGGILVSRAGGPKEAKDLSGKTVAVQLGTTYATHVQKMSQIKKLMVYPKDTDAFNSVKGSKVDAWVTDRFLAIEIIKKNPDAKLQMGDLLFTEQVATATAKGNTALLTSLNGALKDLMANGTYKKFSEKYFGQDIRCK